MKRSVLADTGPLYAAADPDDQYHTRAQTELERLNRERRSVLVTYPILLESYALVIYRLGKQVASKWLGETMDGADLSIPLPKTTGRLLLRRLALKSSASRCSTPQWLFWLNDRTSALDL
jgi:predicted nucleic acid-binding protein